MSTDTQQIILLTGISGSGKSVALNVLEDEGFYCIDNLPVPFVSDVVHALQRLSAADVEAGVTVAALDEAIGRGRGDMRTPLNLQSLAEQGHVALLPDGGWALTPEGVEWIREDDELSDR